MMMPLWVLLFFAARVAHCIDVPDYFVDTDRCEKDMRCLIRDSCLPNGHENKEKLLIYTFQPMKSAMCDVFVQVKVIDEKSVHVIMQTDVESDSQTTVTLKHGEFSIKCGETKPKCKSGTCELYGKRQYSWRGKIFCSVVYTLTDNDYADLQAMLKTKALTMSIGPLTLRSSIRSYADFWPPVPAPTAASLCDVKQWDQTPAITEDDDSTVVPAMCGDEMYARRYTQKSVNKFDDLLGQKKCKYGKIKLMRKDMCETVEVDEIVCNPNQKWEYAGIDIQRNPFRIVLEKTAASGPEKIPFSTYCVDPVLFCTKCGPLPVDLLEGPEYDTIMIDTPYECKRAKCKNGFVTSYGKRFDGIYQCSKNKKPEWVFTARDEQAPIQDRFGCYKEPPPMLPPPPTPVPAAETYDCYRNEVYMQTINFDCPPHITCKSMVFSTDLQSFQCGDDKYSLIVTSLDSKSSLKFECNPTTGLYQDEFSEQLDPYSNVYCALRDIQSTEHPKPIDLHLSELSFEMAMYYGMAGGFIIFFVPMILTGIIVCIVHKCCVKEDSVVPDTDIQTKRSAIENADDARATPLLVRRKWPYCAENPWTEKSTNMKPSYATYWNRHDFNKIIRGDFVYYAPTERAIITNNLLALNHYAYVKTDEPEEQEVDSEESEKTKQKRLKNKKPKPRKLKGFGTIAQVFDAFYEAVDLHLQDTHYWDKMWRFMRLMYGYFDARPEYKVLATRTRDVLLTFARPILTSHGYHRGMTDTPMTVYLRVLAIRILLFFEEQDVLEHLRVMAFRPVLQMEPPLRMIILQYMVRNSKIEDGTREELRKELWKYIEMDPVVDFEEEQGTLRQHCLYALCTAYDAEKKGAECDFMRDILSQVSIYNPIQKAFTPQDQLFAYMGACEYPSNMKAAREEFARLHQGNAVERIEELARFRVHKSDNPRKMPQVLEAWKADLYNLLELVSETCDSQREFNHTYENMNEVLAFCKLNGPERLVPFNDTQLRERAHNFSLFFNGTARMKEQFIEATKHCLGGN